jgi:hypothetical protein
MVDSSKYFKPLFANKEMNFEKESALALFQIRL